MPSTLAELKKGQAARIVALHARDATDTIARRLAELGFVANESVQVVARGPFGGNPIMVRIGSARFALRRAEASRVEVRAE